MRIGVIGLGSIGLGMAASLQRAGHSVVGVDLAPERRAAFEARGGRASASAVDAATEVACVFCVVVNAAQTESVLFGAQGIAEVMPQARCSCPARRCRRSAREGARRPARRCSAAITSIRRPAAGRRKAMAGEITIMGSGAPAAFDAAAPALEAVAAKVYRLGDAPGRRLGDEAGQPAARRRAYRHGLRGDGICHPARARAAPGLRRHHPCRRLVVDVREPRAAHSRRATTRRKARCRSSPRISASCSIPHARTSSRFRWRAWDCRCSKWPPRRAWRRTTTRRWRGSTRNWRDCRCRRQLELRIRRWFHG